MQLASGNRMTLRTLYRQLAIVAVVGFIAIVGVSWYVGGNLLRPANRAVASPPNDVPIVETTLPSKSGSRIATWYVPAEDSSATVILVHGIRGNRSAMIERARMLRGAGYSTVMIDLQAHGESPGDYIGLGHLERHDVRAAVEFARVMNPNHRIGVVGCSLGGAATLLASPLDIDALVLESVYGTISEAVHNRVAKRLGPLAHAFTPALLCQLRPRLGISTSDLCPIDCIADCGCPVLIAVGSEDRYTTVAETERMLDAAQEPKQLVIFQGAGHTNLCAFDAQMYEAEVLPFLATHLGEFPAERMISE